MKNTFEYGSYSYEYFVEFSERKSMTLVVRPDMRIIARVPIDVTLDEIETFMKRKWRWLEKQLTELRKYRKSHLEKQYVSGESFYYLGRQYMMIVEKGEDEVRLNHGRLQVMTSKGLRDSEHNKMLLESWLSARRKVFFLQEYRKAIKLFGYTEVPELGERSMVRRWGSYTSDGKVLLNPRLIEAPRESIYYVCVHELCHKISRKHDDKFYEELNKRMPNWRRVKESLEVRHG